MDQKVFPPELDALANEVGDFICYWGFKKVHGRIWTHLYLSGSSLDAGQLIQRLKVSKALISLSLNDLLRYEVILESGKSERGTQTYVANPDLMQVILKVLQTREQKMLSNIESRFKSLSAVSPENRNHVQLCELKLEMLGQMIREAHSALHGFLSLSSVDFASWMPFTRPEQRS